jgi:hypothetical protein
MVISFICLDYIWSCETIYKNCTNQRICANGINDDNVCNVDAHPIFGRYKVDALFECLKCERTKNMKLF